MGTPASQNMRAPSPPRPGPTVFDMQIPANLASVSDAAARSGRSERALWYDLEAGRLTRYRAPGKTFVDLDELAALLEPRPA